jgi:uncharacterized membrane protein
MFKTNIIYGLVILIPVAIIFLLLSEIVGVLSGFGEALGIQTAYGTMLAVAAAVLLVLALCYGVGAMVRKEAMGLSFDRILDDEEYSTPVLVNLFGPGTAVFGLLVEENADDTLTIFVPSAPALTVGMIHIVDPDRVTRLKAGVGEVGTCVAEWGVGSGKILDKAQS